MSYATINKSDTSYLINSVQKFMTATMLMRAVEKGKVKLSDKLAKFYPEVPGSKQISINDLLQMQSGLDLKKGVQLGQKPFVSDHKNMLYAAKNTVFNPKLLHKRYYSSLNYVYLSGIVSLVYHKSYEQVVRDTYIKPLHLKETAFVWDSPAKLKKIGFVQGNYYDPKNGHVSPVKLNLPEIHGELGAGSLVMSNKDLYKALQASLDGTLLTAQSRKILFTGQAPVYYNGGLYNNPGFKLANGAGNGYYNFVRVTPDGKNALIIQTNMAGGNFMNIRSKISKIFTQVIG